ncbi:DUF6364 family protein [Clostridium perfringens]
MASTSRIPEGKTRIVITLEDEVIEKIKQVAEKNMRTVSNEIGYLIKEKYMNEE